MNLNMKFFTMIAILFLLLMTASIGVDAAKRTNPKQPNISESISAACNEPQAPGMCRGRMLRYAYNPPTRSCVAFYYTGCGSTANNFLTFEECRRDCMMRERY